MSNFTKVAITGLVASAALAAPAAAQGLQEGVYLELRGGATFLSESELSGPDVTALGFSNTDLEFKTGFVIDGAVGYAHSSGFRGELALGYRENDFDELSGTFAGAPFDIGVDGDLLAVSFMGNVYYDISLGSEGSAVANLVPFVGVGIGTAYLEVDGELGDGDDTVFAYQGMAGLAYRVTPNVSLTATYTYFATTDPEFGDTDAEYETHNITAGFRYNF
ncbi:MAG: outer membrane beta-barrel protein [Minwuiales bacterium]|nr:outer membrane beta-barrel protein [Minwuiales bacterium]